MPSRALRCVFVRDASPFSFTSFLVFFSLLDLPEPRYFFPRREPPSLCMGVDSLVS